MAGAGSSPGAAREAVNGTAGQANPRPNCECHGLPQYWYPDKLAAPEKGGYWKCAVRKREVARKSDRKRRKLKLERQREQYHAGGWMTRRLYVLGRQRERVIEQLQQLDKEATEC